MVVDSRSKNIFHATVGPERVYTPPQTKFQCAPLSVPASIFEINGLLRKANKPMLASAIRKLVDTENEIPSQPVKYVLDGGSLLQRMPWKRGTSYASIIDSYVAYVKRKYTKAVIVLMAIPLVLPPRT